MATPTIPQPPDTSGAAQLPPGSVKSYLGNLLYQIGEYSKKQYGLPTDNFSAQIDQQSANTTPQQQAQANPQQHSAIRQRLSNGLQGMSDALAAYAHIPTQFQKQQQQAQTGIAQQQADTMENYRQMQAQALAGGMPTPVTSQESQILGVPVGTMLSHKDRADAYKQLITNQGKANVATINQGVQVPVTDDMVQKFGLKPGSTIGAKAATQLAGLEGKNLETKSQMINGEPHQVIRNKATGEVIHDMGIDPTIAINKAKANAFANAKASLTPFQSFDSDGHLVTISAGQAIASGAPAATAWNTLYGATGSTKSQGQAAGAVAEHIPQFQDAVRKLDAKGELGPVMGRLNTYLAQGYGGDDKDIAEFVTTMGLLKSGAVRAHFGARGGAAILDKFDKNLNPAMTANDLIGSTDAINNFLTTYKQTGSNANTPKTNVGGAQPTHVYVPGKGIQSIGK